jgi:hypothetical protein
MGYTQGQIEEVLLKADKTMYRLGSDAYNDMFAEDSEILDYERDIIFLYKKAVEWADDFYVGTTKLDKVVEVLEAKCNIYAYGKLTPLYSDVVYNNSISSVSPYFLKATPLSLGAGMTGSADFTGASVIINLDYTYIKNQVRDYYLHDQQTSSDTWVVTHNMNKYPSINIVDTANDIIMGEVRYNSLNQLTITFTAAVSGKAYLN